MTDYKTLYDAIVNLNIPIEKQGKFANDKDLWFEYAHFPYILEKSNQSDAVDINIPLTFEAKADNTEIYFLAYDAESQTRTIEVSTDNGETWTEFTSENYDEGNNTPIATLNMGQKALVRGNNPNGMGMGEDDFCSAGSFQIVGETYVYGNIMSLLSKENFASMKEVPEYAFPSLFENYDNYEWTNEHSLFSHPIKKLLIPATTLAKSCYAYMFSGCTGLTIAPELPATTLANSCYCGMFRSCKYLNIAPKLPATSLAISCYSSMFNDCTSITIAPELPATTLAEGCYSNMFGGCTSLITTPELPATILAHSCYSNMFSSCTSLTNAPELPATTLAEYCYSSMFRNCTSLTVAPELPATTLTDNCYKEMFYHCTNLITAPELPATTLSSFCYAHMFDRCTGLTTAPELPAITLANKCYEFMFSDCANLSFVKCAFTTTPGTSYTNNWLANVSATGTFVKNSEATWDVTGANGIPTGWTVETA